MYALDRHAVGSERVATTLSTVSGKSSVERGCGDERLSRAKMRRGAKKRWRTSDSWISTS